MSTLRRSALGCHWAAVAAVLLVAVSAALASTITPLRFDELVRRADTVVEGVVVDIQVLATGADLPPPDADGPPGERPPSAPRSVGVEGGRMLFTHVTLAVEQPIVGAADSEVRLVLAGGTDGAQTVRVFGMPTFEIGGRYIVFLRPGYQNSNVPLLGVDQGFFEVVRDPATGQEMLLDASGNIVIDVAAERVIVRHNPDRAPARTPRLAPAPVPEAGKGIQAGTSPEAELYWLPNASPMAPADFQNAVRAMKEDQP